jgi:hypothetical protein
MGFINRGGLSQPTAPRKRIFMAEVVLEMAVHHNWMVR